MSTATLPITNRYYPRLSEIITVDNLPEFLSFVEHGLDNLLNGIHYKNLQYSKSHNGDSAFYSLDIISANIGLPLPFGLRLVLNPDLDGNTSISSFPVSLQYRWGILGFLRSFDFAGFSFTPEAFYQLGLEIFKVNDEQVIAHILNFFVDPADPEKSKYQELVDVINGLYPAANLSLPEGQEPSVDLVASAIKQNTHIPKSVSEVMFAAYILQGGLDQTRQKLQEFYNLIVPGGIEDYTRELITPHVKATLTLSAGIEFPTNILQPVTAAGVPIPNTKSIFRFGEATFYVDSDAGIGYNALLAGSLIPEYNQIAGTGLIISFINAKLDLSRKTNIPEADAAGYGPDFVGLYVQHAGVTFGRFGKENPNHASATISADNLLIGTGGISGTIKLEDNGLIHRNFGDFAVKLDTFELTFRQNAITNCDVKGELSFPIFKDADGNPAKIGVEVMFKDSGNFSITAKPSETFPPLRLPNVFDLHVRTLKLGEENGLFYFEVGGLLSFTAVSDLLGDFLPKNIEITKLRVWENGHLEFVGGIQRLDVSFTMKLGPIKLEVDHLTITPYQRTHDGIERSYLCVGFDGMLNVQQPSTENSIAHTQYSGAVSFSMPKLHISGSAGMRLDPDIPSLLVDIGLELPAPIPIFAGLGIYGFRGLIGQHYIPSKKAAGLTDDASWWDYYKAPDPLSQKKGIQINKFADASGFSIGAGATIGTTFDDGFVFTSKLFIMLGLPDLFLLAGTSRYPALPAQPRRRKRPAIQRPGQGLPLGR